MSTYLHGVEVVEAAEGARPIALSDATFIGIVGTSLDGPFNEPVTTRGGLRGRRDMGRGGHHRRGDRRHPLAGPRAARRGRQRPGPGHARHRGR